MLNLVLVGFETEVTGTTRSGRPGKYADVVSILRPLPFKGPYVDGICAYWSPSPFGGSYMDPVSRPNRIQ